MDLPLNSCEVILNGVLLLVYQLMCSNSQIQKIIAFENAFEWLMTIINQESYSDGCIIVEDYIVMMQNLLKGNSSIQSGFVQRGKSNSTPRVILPVQDNEQHELVEV